MYTTDITLGTNVYSLTTQRINASIRSDAAQPLSEPNTLTISHENAKNGRRSSVVIFDDIKVLTSSSTLPLQDNVKVMLKVQFNPLGGRTTNEADINALLADLVSFISEPTNVTKFLNQES